MPTLRVAIDASRAMQGANVFAGAAKSITINANATVGAVTQVNNHLSRGGSAAQSMIPGYAGMLRVFLGFLGVRAVVKTLADFETGMVGVIKTTNMTIKDAARFEDQMISLSTKLPIATTELLEIAKAAGQLGVRGNDNLLLFTDTIGKMGVAANIHGESAATRLAQILNITGEGMGEVKKLADAIVNLGNNTAVAGAESQILRIANEVARGTAAFRVSAREAAALGAAYGQLGVRAESAGTASFKVFRFLEQASREQIGVSDANLKRASSVIGVDPDKFKDMFAQSSANTFKEFVIGLGKLQKSGASVNEVLDDMGLKDNRLRKSIQGLASNTDLLGKTFDLAAKSGGALDREANLAFGTLSRQWQLFKNTLGAAILQLRDQKGILSDTLGMVNQALRIALGLEPVTDKTSEAVKNLAVALRAVGRIVHDVFEAFAILIGVKDPLTSTSVAVDALVKGMKLLLAVFVAYEAVKVIEVLNGARLAVLGLGKGVAGSVSAASLLLTLVLAIGAALAGWAIGQTLFEQFKSVQVIAEDIRHTFALLSGKGPNLTLQQSKFVLHPTDPKAMLPVASEIGDELVRQKGDQFKGFGVQMAIREAMGPDLVKDNELARKSIDDLDDDVRSITQSFTKMYVARLKAENALNEPDVHANRMKEIDDLFKKATGGDIGFGKAFSDNFSKAIDGMTGGLSGFVKQLPVVRQMVAFFNNELEHSAQVKTKGENDYYEAVDQAIDALIKEREVIGKLPAIHDEIIQKRHLEAELDKTGVLTQEEINEALEDWARIFRQNQQLKAKAKINEELLDMERESELLRYHGDEYERQSDVFRILNEFRKQGIDLDDQTIEGVKKYINSLHDLKEQWEHVWNVAESVGEAFGNAFEDAIFQGKSWKEAMLGFIKDVSQAIYHEFVTKQIIKLVSNAIGHAFGPSNSDFEGSADFDVNPDGGPAKDFALGGTITSPTFFTYGNGKRGRAGEAGIEHLVPDGEYQAMRRGGTTVIQNITIQTPDVQGFKKSRRQVQDALRKAAK